LSEKENAARLLLSKSKSLASKSPRSFNPIASSCLVGSYAYGQPTEDPDVDLLVILPFEELPVYKAIEIRREVKPSFPLDLMARTSEQIQQRLDMGNFLFKTLLTKVASSMRPITQEWITKAESDFALTAGDRLVLLGCSDLVGIIWFEVSWGQLPA